MFSRCDLDTEKNAATLEVVPGSNPQREILTRLYMMEVYIISRKDAMGSFIYAIINDHLLDAAASSIRKLKIEDGRYASSLISTQIIKKLLLLA